MKTSGPGMSRELRLRPLWTAGLEGALLFLSLPFLLFPARWPRVTAAVLAALGLVWLLRWGVSGVVWPVTPFNGALLLFAFTIGVGVLVTPVPEETLPKATGLILGLAVLRFVKLWLSDRGSLASVLVFFALVGAAILVVGLMGTDWRAKVPGFRLVMEHLPDRVVQLPDAPQAGINPNQLAGALMLYLPLAVVAVVDQWAEGRRTWALWGAVLGLLLVSGVLLLTQSRGGWMGGVASLGTLAILWGLSASSRWARWSALVVFVLTVGVVIGVVFWLGGFQQAGEALLDQGSHSALEGSVGTISIQGRLEIWSRALYAIADFPFTGCGLGAFRRVAWVLYPLFLVPAGTDFAHAHNIFLQTALDLGLPGLVAYLALLGLAAAVCWQAIRRGGRRRRLALGLLAGLVGLHVYGLTDALALGSKPGLALWMVLGLIAGLERSES